MSTGVWSGIILAIIIILIVLAIVLTLVTRVVGRRRRSQRLHETFGPEYDRTVSRFGNRDRAEAELQGRQERVEGFNIQPLAPADHARFSEAWRATQARFVDEPAAATAAADRLVTDLLVVRGYPMHEFEQRAADVSVHHPDVVANYRKAHATSLASEQGQASTEDLRTAMIHYRELFDELLGKAETTQPESRERTEV
ncbi:MAG: hypothetical protein ACRDID_23130 [Ktedonobacterales bacterium]